MIHGSNPILDGNQFSIEFSDADGRRLLVIVPTIIMRDYLPLLVKAVAPRAPASATSTFFRIPKTWRTGTTASYPLVLLLINDEEPIGFSPKGARDLADELVQLATSSDARVRTAQ
jgi:hypothetical protein